VIAFDRLNCIGRKSIQVRFVAHG